MGICCCKKESEAYVPPEPNDLYYNYASYSNQMGRREEEKNYKYYYKDGTWEAIEIIETGARMDDIY